MKIDDLLNGLKDRLSAVRAENAKGQAEEKKLVAAIEALEGKVSPAASTPTQVPPAPPWWTQYPYLLPYPFMTHGYGCKCETCKPQPFVMPLMPGVICTCGQAWFGITQPPPCPAHPLIIGPSQVILPGTQFTLPEYIAGTFEVKCAVDLTLGHGVHSN